MDGGGFEGAEAAADIFFEEVVGERCDDGGYLAVCPAVVLKEFERRHIIMTC